MHETTVERKLLALRVRRARLRYMGFTGIFNESTIDTKYQATVKCHSAQASSLSWVGSRRSPLDAPSCRTHLKTTTTTIPQETCRGV